MFEPISHSAPLVVIPGFRTFKRCACGALFNVATPGDRCPDCTFPLAYSGGEWVRLVDITAETHAAYPETRRFPAIHAERPVSQGVIVEEAHSPQ